MLRAGAFVDLGPGQRPGAGELTAVRIGGAVGEPPGVQQEVNIWVHWVNAVTLGISHPSCWLSWLRVMSAAAGGVGLIQVLVGQERLSPILGEGHGEGGGWGLEGGGFAVGTGFGFSTEYKTSLQAVFSFLNFP